MPHIVLLGDSVFDNAVYSHPEPDVTSHLRARAPAGTQVTLLAVDGSVTESVHAQVRKIPADATHLVLSSGGNDALSHQELLSRPARSVATALELFFRPVAAFAASYQALVEALSRHGLPLAVCTVYNGNLPPEEARAAQMGVSFFDDAIQRAARGAGAHVIELREICTERADYANPIEPSGQGGAKIAEAILRWVFSAASAAAQQ